MSTTTLNRHQTPPTGSEPVLASMSQEQRRHFKNTYRTLSAMDAGANLEQLTAVTFLELGFDTHFPTYNAGPDGTLIAAYSHPDTGTVRAHVSADGRIEMQR